MVVRVITQFDRLGIVYTALAKVANTSIKHALIKGEGLGDFEKPHAQDIPVRTINSAEAVQRRSELFSFAFVRNPWDRLVSCWADKCGVNSDVDMSGYGLPRGVSFEDFVGVVSQLSDPYSEIHFKSQTPFLCHGPQIAPSFIGRFEHLRHDWRTVQNVVMSRTGIALSDLRQLRASERRPYRDYYSRRMAMMVEERYQADVDLFGYKF